MMLLYKPINLILINLVILRIALHVIWSNIGIQMERKEITETFLMISN